MAKRNRGTLKHFFRKGAMPSEHQFGDFIDSTLNLIDEGFDKSPENGLEISPQGNQDGLISFCRSNDPTQPIWSVRFDSARAKLFIANVSNQRKETILSLDPDGKIGINTQDPQQALDVEGAIRAAGRIGAYREGSVPADGEWHSITEVLTGCHAFEVMAGAGKKLTGNYALMQAVAMNTFNPTGWFFNFLNLKKRIKYHQVYYRSLGNKLKLRWAGEERRYYLQLKANSNYGDGARIRYFITNLWFDEDMSDCVGPEENKE